MADGVALLVMDVQQAVVERYGEPALVGRLVAAIAAARAAAIPVIFVRVAFRTGFPEVSPRNRSFSALVAQPGGRGFGETDPASQIHPDLAPQPADVVVVKRRVSAFTGSDLEVVLRARGVTTLVLTGIATSGVVLSTAREAADRDYGLVILRDGCADADPEVHRVLMEKVFPRQAEVLSVADWVEKVQRG